MSAKSWHPKLKTFWCENCGERLPDDFTYARCPKCWHAPCPHGNRVGECNACDIESDLAYDSARELRL